MLSLTDVCFILPRMNVFGTRINTDGHGFCLADDVFILPQMALMDTDFAMRRKKLQWTRRKIREIRVGIESILGREIIIRGNSWESRVTEVIEDGTDLASGKELTVAVVACGFQLLQERLVAVDPTHQMVGGNARVAVGKIEHGKLLFAVTSYFHI